VAPIIAHIGYHKTASSWLHHEFYGDPTTGFHVLDKKSREAPVHRIVRDPPLQFDAASVRAEFDPLFANAEAAGLVPVVSYARLSGHAFSGGYDSKLLADRLHEVFPEARIVIVIREQRSIIVSTYKQYVNAGGICKLEHFLEPTRENRRIPPFSYSFYEYEHLIEYYHSIYGRESVLVLPYELFPAEPREFVARISAFAGLTLSEDVLGHLPFTQRTTKARPALWTETIRPFNRFGPRSDLNPEPMFEWSPLAGVRQYLRRKHTVLSSPRLDALAARREQQLRADVAELVGDRYVKSNRRTAEITDIDLASYGWMV